MTDDGRPPLEVPGQKLRDRLTQVADRLDRVGGKKGLPKGLTRLRAVLSKGLEATEPMWPDVRAAFGWVRRFAAVLADKKGLSAAAVRCRYRGLIAALARHRGSLGSLAEAFDHFRKVTRSDWAGLFRSYDVAGLPRTNHELEPSFGSDRYHERRCSGREVACRGRWSAGRCGWWPRPRPGCVRSGWRT